MIEFDETKLIPNDFIDLDTGTYEVKYKNDDESTVYIWVYFEEIGDKFL